MKKKLMEQGILAKAHNPSYSGNRDGEDLGLRPTLGKNIAQLAKCNSACL
jgi:hypothetical protein